MLTWKNVEASKVSVIYIYIYIDNIEIVNPLNFFEEIIHSLS